MELNKCSLDDSDAITNITNDREKPKKVSKCEFCLETFDEFSSSTSLHGVQYLGRGKGSTIEKIWWFIVLIASVTICSFFIKKIWDKWNETPVIVSFSETATSIRHIPFPAITICPTDKFELRHFIAEEKIDMIKKRGWDNLSGKEKFEIESAGLVCDEMKQFKEFSERKFANESVIDFLKNVSARLDVMNCAWKRKKFHFDDEFTYTTNNEGFCRTYNAIDSTELFRENTVQFKEYPIKNRKLTNGWVLETGYPKNVSSNDAYPRISTSPNMDAGLTVNFVKSKKNHDFTCGDFNTGYKVAVHSSVDLPNLSLEYFIAPVDRQLMINIKPVMITTSPELIDYKPERRKCFLSNERMLKYFKIYTVKNCEWECLSNYTYELCDCVGYWMPREPSMPICSIAKASCVNQARSNIEELGTYHEHEETIKIIEIDDKLKNVLKKCNCMSSCTSINYEIEVTQNSIDITDYVKNHYSEKIAALLAEMGETHLKFSFSEAQFIPSRRSELYGISDFLANCGGIMGLFMGFSFLSVAEIFYFLAIRPFLNMRKKYKLIKNKISTL